MLGYLGSSTNGLQNYLSGRYQRVVLNGFSSTYKPVTSGVPQGSILGPLLFMNSISHIPLSSGTKVILYTDDILLYKPINSAEDTNRLQEDVDSILEWIREHGLTPNHAKTKLLTVTRSRKPVPTNLNIGGHNISPSPSVKYLGITLSSQLTWSEHVTTICKAAKRQIGLIHRQLHQAPVDVCRKIVHTAILPKLEYCSAVWDPHHKHDIAKLDSVQRFAGRMVLRNWTADIADLLSTLGWSPLKVRRRNIELKVLYNILNNYSRIPQTAFTYHPHPSPRHPHNKILFQPFVSTLSHCHSFFVDVIPVWNTLSPLVVNSPSPNTFKTRLCSFL